ncbi:MAG: hypothetical protein ACXV5Q_14800 [Frankiaceae bacterium]
MTVDLVSAGGLLGQRYRLVVPLSVTGASTLWRGSDLLLDRPVTVRVLRHSLATPTEIQRFVAAAVAASRLANPVAASTYDVDTVDDPEPLTYLVTEWVVGEPLEHLLADGPLPVARARALALPLAGLLAQAHADGVTHGMLRPSDVLITRHGHVKVLGLAIAGALPGTSRQRDPAAADVRAVGAIFYAALTARWPYGAAYGLGAAPCDSAGRPRPPRQVRAGVAREADAIAAAALGLPDSPHPQLTTAAEFLTALQRLPVGGGDGRSPVGAHLEHPVAAEAPAAPPLIPPARRSHRFWRRVLLIVLILLVVGAVSWWAGASLGRVRTPASSGLASTVPPAPTVPGVAGPPTPAGQPTAPSTTGAVLPLAAVEDFDPPPGDGHEHPEHVADAHDGDLTTAWMTDRYFDDPRFGAIKTGVGLRVDLGQPMQVSQVELVIPSSGASLELRAGDSAGALPSDYPVVAATTATDTHPVLRPADTGAHRYWLVWLTGLTRTAGGYQGGIAEMVFRS